MRGGRDVPLNPQCGRGGAPIIREEPNLSGHTHDRCLDHATGQEVKWLDFRPRLARSMKPPSTANLSPTRPARSPKPPGALRWLSMPPVETPQIGQEVAPEGWHRHSPDPIEQLLTPVPSLPLRPHMHTAAPIDTSRALPASRDASLSASIRWCQHPTRRWFATPTSCPSKRPLPPATMRQTKGRLK